jgi:hypothetical protein
MEVKRLEFLPATAQAVVRRLFASSVPDEQMSMVALARAMLVDGIAMSGTLRGIEEGIAGGWVVRSCQPGNEPDLVSLTPEAGTALRLQAAE